MEQLNKILIEAVEKVLPESNFDYESNPNMLNLCDSFSVVSIVLETESMLEESYGNYITLGNENLFDVSQSPMKSWQDWCCYVRKSLGNS